jgi:hypothetical protein
MEDYREERISNGSGRFIVPEDLFVETLQKILNIIKEISQQNEIINIGGSSR